MPVETRSRHTRNADLFDQVAGELNVIGKVEGANVGHYVIGAPRTIAVESSLFQRRDQVVSTGAIFVGQIAVVAGGQTQRCCSGFLQRRGRTDSEKVVDFTDGIRDGRRRHRPADTPSRDAVTLGETVDGDGAVAHPVEPGDRNVFCILVQDVLVNFVGDRQHVELNAQIANQFQFLTAEHLAGRIVRRVQDDCLGVMLEGLAQFQLVESPLAVGCLRRTQTNKPRLGSAQDGVRSIVFIERLEDDNLVSLVADCEQRRNHRLGRSAADNDFFFGIDFDSLPFSCICRAMALRRFFAPHVMAYWLTSPSIASCAAFLISAGAAKSGKPCARLMALCCIACRVISRITDSVKCSTLSLR